jgi:hypothetical protein
MRHIPTPAYHMMHQPAARLIVLHGSFDARAILLTAHPEQHHSVGAEQAKHKPIAQWMRLEGAASGNEGLIDRNSIASEVPEGTTTRMV